MTGAPRIVALVLAAWLVTAGVARASDDDATETECNFMVGLCRVATQALERARTTPPEAETLAYKHQREAELNVRAAKDAARMIEERHGGKRPACFADPACSFLTDE